jgi:hypothetical protein
LRRRGGSIKVGRVRRRRRTCARISRRWWRVPSSIQDGRLSPAAESPTRAGRPTPSRPRPEERREASRLEGQAADGAARALPLGILWNRPSRPLCAQRRFAAPQDEVYGAAPTASFTAHFETFASANFLDVGRRCRLAPGRAAPLPWRRSWIAHRLYAAVHQAGLVAMAAERLARLAVRDLLYIRT